MCNNSFWISSRSGPGKYQRNFIHLRGNLRNPRFLERLPVLNRDQKSSSFAQPGYLASFLLQQSLQFISVPAIDAAEWRIRNAVQLR